MADMPTRYLRLPHGATIQLGGFAGLDITHAFMPDGRTGTSCLACYGWADDARHAFHAVLPVGGDRG